MLLNIGNVASYVFDDGDSKGPSMFLPNILTVKFKYELIRFIGQKFSTIKFTVTFYG